jgi:autotransporter-associated beta strand protein
MKISQGIVFALLLLAVAIPATQAAPLYWDADGTAAGNVPATGAGLGGAGNWDQSSPLWFNGSADIPWVNANNDDAIFSGTAGTVTLTENISAGNLYFTNATGNYVITNATGAEVLTVAGAIDTGGGEHTIGAPIANSGTLNKNGAGRLHLPVDNGATLVGSVMINQGDVSVENNNGAGQNTSITVANGAALVLNGGTAGSTAFYPTVTINGSGVATNGSLRNLSGVTTFYGQIILGENNSVIYSDSGSALVYDGEYGALTDNGNNYNLVISGSGTGNVHLGATSIGGSLIVEGPASCYTYLTGISPTTWNSTYISSNATFYVENNNSFGTQPATLMTTNVLLDGGTINSGGTYTMYATDGITVTTNGGTLTNTSGTWTTCNIYSPSNVPVTFTGSGSYRPGGAAGTTTGTINFGTGAIIKGGSGDCNMTYANPSLEIYSNLVVNGGSLTFNYDQSSGQSSSLGALPSTLNSSNIVLNGGALHAGHSTTIGATRGIYIAAGGGTIEDVTSGGTVTINSPIIGPGSVSFPLGKSGSTTAVTLAGNNSYTGTTTVGASCTVNVGSGGTTGTLGTGNTTDSGTLTFNRTGSYSYGGVISGAGIVNKAASGIVTLTGANTYSGNTTISAGTLLINNTSGSGTGTGAVAVNSGGSLGGSGTISGAVTVASGGTLALGLSTLTMGNNLSLAGNVSVSVNKSLAPANGTAVVSGTLANTGTGSVTVSNLGPALVAGDTFQLFSQAVSGGATMTVSGGAGVVWANNLAVNGTISVVSATSPTPHINQVQISAGNFIFSGTNGAGGDTYYVLSSTNLALPLSQWTYVSTNSFLGNGQFFITNPINPGNPQQFYLLQAQ